MLEVYAYNSGKGDCIRVRYGLNHNIFIDTGVSRFGQTFKRICNDIVSAGESLDVLLLTHADNDHIGGILSNLRLKIPCLFREVWMNHEGAVSVGDTLLSTRENNEVYARLIQQGATVMPMLKGEIRTVANAVITALSPEITERKEHRIDVPLAKHNDYGISLAALADVPIAKKDTSINNKNSIVCTFEYEGHKLLFTGDAWAEDVVKAEGDFDLIKLPHHGSVHNISESYKDHINSKNFLICTDGVSHPDKQTIAKLEKWYGTKGERINVFSPVAWWERGFMVQGDKEHHINYYRKDGLVIAW